MKKVIYIFLFAVCCALQSEAQEPAIFENRDLGLAFSATSQWTKLTSDDPGMLELINSNSNLKVKMWFENTDLGAVDCLKRFMLKEGIAASGAPFKLDVDNRNAYGIIGLCNEMHKPVKTLMMAIDGKDGYYIVHFKCPNECFQEHRSQMDDLISSVNLLNMVESQSFFANHRASL